MVKNKITGHDGSPLIVVLGGVHGVGKTSLAHRISNELNIYYGAGFGTIIQTLKVALPNDIVFQEWGQYQNLKKESLLNKFLAECWAISPFVKAISKHAKETGESYIFDGVQSLPETLPLGAIKYFLVTVSDGAEYKLRLEHPAKTKTSHKDTMSFEGEKIIEELMIAEAKKYHLPIIDNSRPIEFAAQEIISHLL